MTILARLFVVLAVLAAAGKTQAVSPLAPFGVLSRWQGQATVTHASCEAEYRSFESRTRLAPSARREARAACRREADRLARASRRVTARREAP